MDEEGRQFGVGVTVDDPPENGEREGGDENGRLRLGDESDEGRTGDEVSSAKSRLFASGVTDERLLPVRPLLWLLTMPGAAPFMDRSPELLLMTFMVRYRPRCC